MRSTKKVEVIVEAIYTKRFLDLLKKNDIYCYTLIRQVQGCGGHGHKMSDNVTDVGSNDYLFTIIDEAYFEEIKEELRAFIKKYGGKCFVTDVMMLL